jgi:hypothetical protein
MVARQYAGVTPPSAEVLSRKQNISCRRRQMPTQRWIGFSFKCNAGTSLRWRFDLKEKSWPNEMENGARGHLNMFAH